MKKVVTIFSIFIFGININAQEISEEQYMSYFIVVSDTSRNYVEIRQKMFTLSKRLKTEIDTMGREFNKAKNLICLPENHGDEIYAGNYYPRRYPSETLSLEYLSYYTNKNIPSKKTIALVAIVTRNKAKAMKKLKEVKKYSDKAFIMDASVYMGCMH